MITAMHILNNYSAYLKQAWPLEELFTKISGFHR
jgi:hypothetical protein